MKKFVRAILGSLFRVHCLEPVVALTFDDGPDPIFTNSLLDLLKRYNAKATFFIVGQAAVDHPEIIKRIFAEGHCVGNHGWSHTSMTGLSTAERVREIRKCSQSLGAYESPYFRPPFGHQTLFSAFLVRALGYKIIGGDIVPEDWKNISAGDLAANMQSKIKPGSIVVLHDRLFKVGSSSHPDRTAMLSAVENLLSNFESHFRFVTIKSLLENGRPDLRIWTSSPT